MDANLETAGVAEFTTFCPGCRQKIAMPEGLRKQSVSCPTCQYFFIAGEALVTITETEPEEIDRIKAEAESIRAAARAMGQKKQTRKLTGTPSERTARDAFNAERSALAARRALEQAGENWNVAANILFFVALGALLLAFASASADMAEMRWFGLAAAPGLVFTGLIFKIIARLDKLIAKK